MAEALTLRLAKLLTALRKEREAGRGFAKWGGQGEQVLKEALEIAREVEDELLGVAYVRPRAGRRRCAGSELAVRGGGCEEGGVVATIDAGYG